MFEEKTLLDESLGLFRVSRTQTYSGFDLFSGSSTESRNIPMLFLSRISPDAELFLSRAFTIAASPVEQIPEGGLLENGRTLSEIQADSSKQDFGEIFQRIWILLEKLEQSGFILTPFTPSALIFSETDEVWKFLPVPQIFYNSEHKQGINRKEFIKWLVKQTFDFPETISEILRILQDSNISEWQKSIWEEPSLWTAKIPASPFSKLKISNTPEFIKLSWESNNAEGLLSVGVLLPGIKLSETTRFIPARLAKQIFKKEYPVPDGTNVLEMETNDVEIMRMCGIRKLGPWMRLGKVFCGGGLPDVTFYDVYWDEQGLVLDLDWPEQVKRTRILASPIHFPKTSNDPNTKIWEHNWFNPLIPKRIPFSEFEGWNTVYLQLFSIADSDENQISLGLNPKSRQKIQIPEA